MKQATTEEKQTMPPSAKSYSVILKTLAVLLIVTIITLAVIGGAQLRKARRSLSLLSAEAVRQDGEIKRLALALQNLSPPIRPEMTGQDAEISKLALSVRQISKTLNAHIANDAAIPDYLIDLVALLAINNSIDNSYLNERDARQMAIKLCDVVFDVPFTDGPSKRGLRDVYLYYIDALKNQNLSTFFCQGRSTVLRFMLEAKGIPAREILMSLDLNGTYTHNTVEFYDGQSWLAIDPSYAIMWKKSGTDKFLSYRELYEAYAANEAVESVYIGSKTPPRIRLEDDPLPFKDVMTYLLVKEASIYGPNGPVIFEEEIRPEGWDGVILFTGGNGRKNPVSFHDYGVKAFQNR
jgi:hypothetical protein